MHTYDICLPFAAFILVIFLISFVCARRVETQTYHFVQYVNIGEFYYYEIESIHFANMYVRYVYYVLTASHYLGIIMSALNF